MSKFVLILFVLCLSLAAGVNAQTDAQAKTDALVAALAKTKYKKKEKKNISIEIYIDIKSEPVVKADAREYAGVYDAGEDYRLELRVAADGRVEGSGYDRRNFNGKRENFTFKDARIEGALLTATKVYENGETENFEALFNNRTVVQGKNANEIETRETRYGLGFILTRDDWTNRIFLDYK